ncbi:MAG: uroporphyrinogen decarboxylase [Deltaproteobacteria bacterium]|nr:uroporphyrinogen decarboxylase [Deltaproteobacteria bacterium]
MDFNGKTVVAFESRMALPTFRLIEKSGGKPFVAPSLKEVPLSDNPAVFDFYRDLKEGKVDILILMTGVATRTLITILETRFPKAEVLATLSDKTKIVVRGPKPAAVCRLHNIPIAITVPEPNTWKEIVAALHEQETLSGKNVAVLEYGIPNTLFLEELKNSGALVRRVPVYKWALPDDLGPLQEAIHLIAENKVDVALFTSATQVDHLIRVASDRGLELALRRGFQRVAIGSIGPVCSQKLAEHQLFADFEATPNKLNELVEQMAVKAAGILEKKMERVERSWVRVVGAIHELPLPRDSSFLRACHLQKNDRIPIWLMRQAGRYMAEYQVSRKKMGFKEMCKNPEVCSEITITAVERLGVDAAIIFSDILLITEPMGLNLEYREGIGPMITNPIRSLGDIHGLKPVLPENLDFVMEAIRITRREMKPSLPLIGFAGAPFTVASYMIEGRGSKNYIPTKALMHNDPASWHELLEKITEATTGYLNAQAGAGADALQIFDSWAGCLTPAEYEEFVLPHSHRLIAGIKKGVAVIHFGSFTPAMLALQKEAGGNVISLDWRMDIGEAAELLGHQTAIQGNLDPVLLFARQDVLLAEAEKILKKVGDRPGFIFNLGHGILPETPVDNVMALVDFVHEWKP